MSAPARITQADMERATKSMRAAGVDRYKIVMDLAKGRIEVIVGEAGDASATQHDNQIPSEDWSDDVI